MAMPGEPQNTGSLEAQEAQIEAVELEFARLIRVFAEKGWPITPVIKGRGSTLRALRAFYRVEEEADGKDA